MILGDSWGVPNYPPTEYIKHRINEIKKLSAVAEIKFQHLGDPPETHLEFLLKDCGYSIINLSISGGSNLETIRSAEEYLNKNKIKIDWLIWFHTESLRDWSEILTSPDTKFSIPILSKQLACAAYKKFAELIKKIKCKTIVIGGQAPIFLKEFKDNIGDVDLLIEDWHADILGVNLPFSHGVCNLNLFEFPGCLDTTEEKKKMLDNIDTILKLDFESVEFPDNAHPGKKAHAELFQKIKGIIDD
jgi:hypothetical protein